MDNPDTLIDDHLDDALTDDTFRQLVDWLRASDEHRQQFVREWLIHSLLHDYISQRQVQADALLRAMTTPRLESRTAILATGQTSPALLEQPPLRLRAENSATSSTVRRVGVLRRRFVGLAALLMIALAVGTLVYSAMQPKVVAMLTQTNNCRWAKASEALADGTLLREGDEIHLLDGRALVTFASGARIVLEGPARLTTQSEMSADFGAGALTTTVPRQAVGFAIHAPLAQLVDLGTEFTARIHADNSLDLQVFAGMVELKLVSDDRQVEGAPLRVSEGVAVKVDGQSRAVKSIEYDASQRIAIP